MTNPLPHGHREVLLARWLAHRSPLGFRHLALRMRRCHRSDAVRVLAAFCAALPRRWCAQHGISERGLMDRKQRFKRMLAPGVYRLFDVASDMRRPSSTICTRCKPIPACHMLRPDPCPRISLIGSAIGARCRRGGANLGKYPLGS
ncbi:hypothetical protein [Xanthomonas translucens]|uniref:hypothetical protein n=1 Tax=Xanthomonas campestris pv. translucens TaxID=343 RepID=UPI0012DB57FD|nr:hypothetical protein [Xanthomonas translucens]MCC8446531.1 hypothetical protein [Xanthomonas translucens pv. translucens]